MDELLDGGGVPENSLLKINKLGDEPKVWGHSRAPLLDVLVRLLQAPAVGADEVGDDDCSRPGLPGLAMHNHLLALGASFVDEGKGLVKDSGVNGLGGAVKEVQPEVREVGVGREAVGALLGRVENICEVVLL